MVLQVVDWDGNGARFEAEHVACDAGDAAHRRRLGCSGPLAGFFRWRAPGGAGSRAEGRVLFGAGVGVDSFLLR